MIISIVTISFNQGAYLEQAIRSILSQNYRDLEYIVVDPGSTDGSRELIETHRAHLHKVILAPDRGPAEGLNNGFAEASGEIYGFLNSDDVLEPSALAAIANAFMARPDLDVVSGHAWLIDAGGRTLRRLYSDRFSLTMAAYGACILIQPSTFVRASAFHRIGGFNTMNKSNWDGELYIDLALSGSRFGRIPTFLSRYRVHPQSITGSARLRHLHQLYRLRMFTKIKGRDISRIDDWLSHPARYLRKVLNMADTYERVRFGSVYKRRLSLG